MNFSNLKDRAKVSFKKNYGASLLIALLMSFVGTTQYANFDIFKDASEIFDGSGNMQSFFTAPFFTGVVLIAILTGIATWVLALFVVSILKVGGCRYFLKLRKDEPTGLSEVIGNFRDGNYKNIVIISLLKSIYIFLWSLLFWIPGIVKSLEYLLTDYILATRPDLDRESVFKMSKNLMYGHKAEAFALELSFIGWGFLAIFTAGILSILYVNPYYEATLAEFYAEVRAQGIANGVITEADLPDYGSYNRYDPNADLYNNLRPAQDKTFYGGNAQNNNSQFNSQSPYGAQQPTNNPQQGSGFYTPPSNNASPYGSDNSSNAKDAPQESDSNT